MKGLAFRHLLPVIYRQLLPEAVINLQIVETKATCDSCLEVPRYKEHLKCCTFHPFLPNYLVGQILRDEQKKTTFVSEVLQHKISKRHYALPLGVLAPVRYQVEFNSLKSKLFGQKEEWLCPYYDRTWDRCGIWRNRGSVCTSFYCQSSKGRRGGNFWKLSLDYLSYVEMVLAEEALVQLDFSPRQISDLLKDLNRFEASAAELKSDSLPLKKARDLWNGYYDDQPGFYLKSLAVIQGLSQKDFHEAMGELGEKITIQFLKAGQIWEAP
jgi:hypothetical protein